MTYSLAPLHGKMILAPLTRGGNLPFRRLCGDFGMEASVGEMVFARYLIAGDRVEKARLRRAENEQFFGVQIATNEIDEGRKGCTSRRARCSNRLSICARQWQPPRGAGHRSRTLPSRLAPELPWCFGTPCRAARQPRQGGRTPPTPRPSWAITGMSGALTARRSSSTCGLLLATTPTRRRSSLGECRRREQTTPRPRSRPGARAHAP